jgi:EmrB/QacA subfamily drug resistance transporter
VPETSQRRRMLILGICCLSLLMVGIDNTIVNVALPALHTDLHASLSQLQWTIDAYTLVLASLLVLSGSTADRFGRRRTFQLGLVLFTGGSLLCSLAPGLGWLIVFRCLQAVGGSMLNPVAMSIITNVFTERKERARAIGVWGGVIGISFALGPIIGGIMIDSVGWRGIFWINVPFGLAALVLSALFIPESRAQKARRPDPVGQTLVIVVLAALTYGVIEAPNRGWTAVSTLALLATFVVALVALVGYEQRRAEPLVEPRLFRSIPFAGATLIAIAAFAAFAGLLFLGSLYLQDVRGYSALVTGLCLIPLAIGALICAPIAGRMVAAHGTRLPLVLAGTLMTAGALILVDLGPHTSLAWVLVSFALVGVGFGFVNPPITNSAVSGLPNSRAGTAAALASTSRQVGNTLGVAVIGSVLNSELHGASITTGFVTASPPAFVIVAGCTVAIIGAGFAVSTARARRSAERAAAFFETDDAPPPVATAGGVRV